MFYFLEDVVEQLKVVSLVKQEYNLNCIEEVTRRYSNELVENGLENGLKTDMEIDKSIDRTNLID